ncbi:phosphopantetheine-binding protein [Micromonospora sp. KLBMP9576]|uniref:phosphopantetheine-binding protein n=1 Tax=Micromonospora sp. KLBMP9576 TaxID=3424769 RepID=UPI003D8BEAE6
MALLDEHGDPVPDGEVGELYLGGPAVARGYRGRPALTAQCFVPDPAVPGARRYRTGDHVRRRPDGVLEFVGRIDGQVKVRGFRVEVDEVAAQLRAHGDVQDAAVVPRPGPAGSTELVGYVVGHRDAAVDPDRISGFVAERLPAAMVPSWIVVLDRLPLTRNGKLDRRALPDPVPVGPTDAAPPAGPTEEFLAAVWQDLLRVPVVGRDQDFFQLGGQSLLATQVVSRIRQHAGVELPVRAVYDTPSLAGLAAAVDRAAQGGRSAAAGIVRVPRTRRRSTTRS